MLIKHACIHKHNAFLFNRYGYLRELTNILTKSLNVAVAAMLLNEIFKLHDNNFCQASHVMSILDFGQSLQRIEENSIILHFLSQPSVSLSVGTRERCHALRLKHFWCEQMLPGTMSTRMVPLSSETASLTKISSLYLSSRFDTVCKWGGG